MKEKYLYEFGEFQLDTMRRVLLRDGKNIPLTHKALETLLFLVKRHGQVVEKEELIEAIWPDTFVEEGSLTRNISVLRKTLGEGPSDHHFIETVPKRGYRFVAEVREVAFSAPAPVTGSSFMGTVAELNLEASTETLVLEDTLDEDSGEISVELPETTAEILVEKESSLEVEPVSCPTPTPGPRFWAVQLGMILGVMALMIAGAVVGIRYLVDSKANAHPFQLSEMKRLTNSGKTIDAAISQDGRYLVYVQDEGELQSLWIRQISTASDVQILPPSNVVYQGLDFSPDGNYVYYNLWDKVGVGVVFRIPTLGGMSSRVVADVMPSLAISPDGQCVAVIRSDAVNNTKMLVIANTDGSGERVLIQRKEFEWLAWPAWSPDGKSISYVGSRLTQKDNDSRVVARVYEMPLQGGDEVVLSSYPWRDVTGMKWLKDKSGLVMAATDQIGAPMQIWFVPNHGGVPQRVTNDVNGYRGLSLATDSNALITVQSEVLSGIWVSPVDDYTQARQITSDRNEGIGFSWTPDDRLVHSSWRSGNLDIWIMDRDGSHKQQLTSNAGVNFRPQVSPDGQTIVFGSTRKDAQHLWKMNIDGSNPQQLTNEECADFACFLPKQDELLYVATKDGKAPLFRASLKTGEKKQLNATFCYLPAVSPDGKYVAYSYWNERSIPQQWAREIMAIDGSEPPRPINIPKSAVGSIGAVMFQWNPNGEGLLYIDTQNGVSNLWELPLNGGTPRQVTSFIEGRIQSFAWSPDRKFMAFGRSVTSSDVIQIRGFSPATQEAK